MCPEVATPCVKDTREEKCNNGLGTSCAKLTGVRDESLVPLTTDRPVARLHVCCESCRVVARQVVGRHADARRQGFTVHPCAVTAMNTYAATFMC